MTTPPRFPARIHRVFTTLFAQFLCFGMASLAFAATPPAERVEFAIPAAPASESFKKFAAQAGVQLLYATDVVTGVKTNAVKGALTPQEAIGQMLAGTPLAAQQTDNGAIVVQRGAIGPNGPRAVTAQSADRSSPTNSGTERYGNAPIELSPFVVNAEEDNGYTATSSLAGSRLNTELRDTGASISVMTAEFLADVGAIDMDEALEYSTNVQEDRNDITAGSNDNGDILTFRSYRVRGVSADITRNYFKWTLSTDTYNLDRIEESRGPNSILFGIGSAGGVLNAQTKRATVGKDFRRVNVTTGSYGSFRASIDINQRAINGRLAFRLNAVTSDQFSNLYFVKNATDRVHVAATYKVTNSTTIRAEAEMGNINQVVARRGNILDGISSWLDLGQKTTAVPITNTTTAGALGYLVQTGARITYINNNNTLFQMQNQNISSGGGAANQVFNNPKYFDDYASYDINTGGKSQMRVGKFNTQSVFLEQKIAAKTYAELAYNHQKQEYTVNMSGQGRTESAKLQADVMSTVPDGTASTTDNPANPYVGQLLFQGDRFGRSTPMNDTDNFRLTFSHEQDFGKWGNYRLAAMGEYQKRQSTSRILQEVFVGSPFNAFPENAANIVWRRQYVTKGDFGTYALEGPNTLGFISNLYEPVSKRTLSSEYVGFAAPSDIREKQKSMLIGLQMRYFGGRLVGGFGYRKDSLDVTRYSGRRRTAADSTGGAFNAYLNEYGQFYDTISDTSFDPKATATAGLVLHLPKGVSVFYNASNTFDLPATNLRLIPIGFVESSDPNARYVFPANKNSKGVDIGLMFRLFGNRLNARVNYYKNDLENETGGFGGTVDGPATMARNVYDALRVAGRVDQAFVDNHVPDSNIGSRSRTVEGYEANLTFNLAKNWRLQANYSYTHGSDTEIAPEIRDWFARTKAYMTTNNYLNIPAVNASDATIATIGQELSRWESVTNTQLFGLEGVTLLGNRRHKANIFTRYDFKQDRLKGLSIGGGYVYAGRSELGLSGIDKLKILRGNSYWTADALVSYRTRNLPLIKRPLTLQLNVKNVFDWNDPISVQLLEAADGSTTIRRWNLLPPRTWRLSAGMEF